MIYLVTSDRAGNIDWECPENIEAAIDRLRQIDREFKGREAVIIEGEMIGFLFGECYKEPGENND